MQGSENIFPERNLSILHQVTDIVLEAIAVTCNRLQNLSLGYCNQARRVHGAGFRVQDLDCCMVATSKREAKVQASGLSVDGFRRRIQGAG